MDDEFLSGVEQPNSSGGVGDKSRAPAGAGVS